MTEFDIFKACFPQLLIDEETFTRLAFCEGAHTFHENSGFAVTRGQHITLLCVAPERQRRGIGTRLLSQCERHIRSFGHDRAVLGGNMLYGAVEGSGGFFRKNGYALGGEFKEMSLELCGFDGSTARSAAEPDVVFVPGEAQLAKLHRAVAAVDEDWVQYFTEPSSVFCARINGEIAAFCIIGADEDCLLSDGATKVGSIGCVGTVPEFRRRGTGLAMVAAAAEHLKALGCGRAFIHMTHLDRWYGKLGAEVFLRYNAAEKELP